MAMPVDNFEWASDANYASGPDVGTPTKVAPSAGEIDSGFVRGTAAVAQHMNWILGTQIKSWLTYLAGLATDSEFLGNSFHFTNDIEIDGQLTINGGADIDGDVTFAAGDVQKYAGAKQYRKMIPLSQFALYENANGTAFFSGYQGIYFYWDGIGGSGDSVGTCNLDLPVGCVLNRVRCGISASGATPSGGGHRFRMTVDRVTYDKTLPTPAGNSQGSDIVKTTTAIGANAILDTGPFSATINDTSHIRITVEPNDKATTGDRDILMWVEVEYASEYFAEKPL